MQPVRIKYDDLVNSPASLADAIEQGLGSGADALGVILITGEFLPLPLGSILERY